MLFIIVLLAWPRILSQFTNPTRHQRISVISRRQIGQTQQANPDKVPNETTVGHVARNELDTHADTSCAGSNWSLLEYSGQICEVTPFIDKYEPVPEIPIATCCTV